MAPQIHSDQGYKSRCKLFVDTPLIQFIERELLPESGLSTEQFYESLTTLVQEFGKDNRVLLKKRLAFKEQIDQWHLTNREQGIPFDSGVFEQYLRDIDYIVDTPEQVTVVTDNVDPEIASIAGPQLVVPVRNARFALNAANARWGSLYDALYGTDAIPGQASGKGYDARRGEQVIRYARDLLDELFPLHQGSHHEARQYQVMDNGLAVRLQCGELTTLADQEKFCGFQGAADKPSTILLKNNDLHIEIQIDPEHTIGRTDSAYVKDVVLESAVTAIQDFEDSVAAVDAEDKAEVYRNMLGLYKGDLSSEFQKGGKTLVRTLAKDREYRSLSGETFRLPGRSTLLIRNVGHLMTTPAVLDEHCCEIPEGILDALVTAVIARYDLRKTETDPVRNSRSGSVYIVKPKMQGPEEVAFCRNLFCRVEQLTGLPENALKIGIMDEEHRTTLNLKACIAEARERVIFINTGFLDRTGSEMHVNMEAGPMVPKTEMKHQQWIKSYEDWNVDTGLQCGLAGHAQIGKGMWAMPDDMADMLQAKVGHPQAGANCAWVPSPTAATLHAVHYHRVNVGDVQTSLAERQTRFTDLLEVPVMDKSVQLGAETVQRELENNAQGILGYVVRWIDQGVGCSKVPDINNVNLMEDRATLRISSQHIANWLHFGVCSEAQVREVFRRMAAIVDQQNEATENYTPMCADLDNSTAYKAALSLVFEGLVQPSGYTEPLLHKYRYRLKHQREPGSFSEDCSQTDATPVREVVAETLLFPCSE